MAREPKASDRPMGKSPISQLNDIKQEQLDRFFNEHDTGDRQPWNEAEWKERREEMLADACQWCGKTEAEAQALQLHHYEEPEFDYEREWIKVENRQFLTSDAFDVDGMVDDPTNCPNCMSTNFYARKTVAPTYRCRRCEYEFPDADNAGLPDLLDAQYLGAYGNGAFYYAKLDWVRGNAAHIREAFEEAYEEHWEEYMSLVETVTICQTCHFMHHEHDMRICDICKEDYGKDRDRFDEDWVCWDCVVDEEGLALCPECGENYYDPARNSGCSDCRY